MLRSLEVYSPLSNLSFTPLWNTSGLALSMPGVTRLKLSLDLTLARLSMLFMAQLFQVLTFHLLLSTFQSQRDRDI